MAYVPRSITGTQVGGFTANRVPFADANGFLTEDADFTFNGSQLGLAVQGATGGLLIGGSLTLYYGAAAQLKTDANFVAGAEVAAYIGNAQQITMGLSGGLAAVLFGSGLDTNIYRAAANILATDDFMRVVPPDATTARYFQIQVTGEANERANMGMLANGTPFLEFGAGGATAPDVILYRSAANVLKTDDKLLVALELEVDGDLNHDGSNVGFYGTAPVAQGAAVADASGGAVIDSQARTAINTLLARLRTSTGVGLIAT